MMDDKGDKMKSEGPYTIGNENGQACIVGPGFNIPGARITQSGNSWGTRLLQLDMNLAHAEGRKSMEKDFQELLSISEMMNAEIDYGSEGTDAFGAWKKARGIE
jgi:hypothetical protein